MMKIRWDLKSAIVKQFGSQVEAARHLRIREARLSYIVRGHVEPTRLERKALENSLGRSLVREALKNDAPHKNRVNRQSNSQ